MPLQNLQGAQDITKLGIMLGAGWTGQPKAARWNLLKGETHSKVDLQPYATSSTSRTWDLGVGEWYVRRVGNFDHQQGDALLNNQLEALSK